MVGDEEISKRIWASLGYVPSQPSKRLMDLCKLAKEGDKYAKAELQSKYCLRIYTNNEIRRINELIKSGIPQNEAINIVSEEERENE